LGLLKCSLSVQKVADILNLELKPEHKSRSDVERKRRKEKDETARDGVRLLLDEGIIGYTDFRYISCGFNNIH